MGMGDALQIWIFREGPRERWETRSSKGLHVVEHGYHKRCHSKLNDREETRWTVPPDRALQYRVVESIRHTRNLLRRKRKQGWKTSDFLVSLLATICKILLWSQCSVLWFSLQTWWTRGWLHATQSQVFWPTSLSYCADGPTWSRKIQALSRTQGMCLSSWTVMQC